ncbi:INT11 protein, partial [Illadopsis cleaveri]|nr:INT11 protein [Illadopsis cleaveri]
VVFATPGMLHAGQSLQIFRKWAGNEKNMISEAVLCPSQLEVKMQVEYMSFSAHADAKGIMQLIRQAEPRNVLLVHGEAKKMEFLKQKIEQEFRGSPFAALPQRRQKRFSMKRERLDPRAAPQPPRAQRIGFSIHFSPFSPQSFRLVSPEQALKELGLAEHQLRFTCRVHIQDPRKEHETVLRVYNHLKGILKDYSVQHLPDGSITVESILIQATAHSEDQGTKVLLVSWTYQ